MILDTVINKKSISIFNNKKLKDEFNPRVYFENRIPGRHPNSDANHASKLLPLIHEYAISETFTIAEGFQTEMLNTKEYLNSLEDFLFRGGKFRAIFRNPETMNQDIKNKLISLKEQLSDQISIKKTSRKVNISSGSGTLYKNINFAFNDSSCFRIELDQQKNIGIWGAYDPLLISELTDIFEIVWNHSDTKEYTLS